MSASGQTLPLEIAAVVRGAYDVGECRASRRITEGRANVSVHLVTSQGQYVLRRSGRRKTRTHLEFEAGLIDHLRSAGYPAPELVPTRSNEPFLDDDGTLYLMTRWIAGSRGDSADPAHVAAAGRGLGRYHRLVSSLPRPRARAPTVDLAALNPLLEEVEHQTARMLGSSDRKRLAQNVESIRTNALRVQREIARVAASARQLIVHGSFDRTSLIFDGAALVGVVDYDRAAFGLRGLDVAYALKSFCRIGNVSTAGRWLGPLDGQRVRSFLTGYREQEDLSAEEIQGLPLMFSVQRFLTIDKKFEKVLAGVGRQPLREARKVVGIAEREATRLGWLEAHGSEVVAAFDP